MIFSKFFKILKLLCLAIMLSGAFFLISCTSHSYTTFPILPGQLSSSSTKNLDLEMSQTVVDTGNNQEVNGSFPSDTKEEAAVLETELFSKPSLQIALPITAHTANYLSKLYAMKKNPLNEVKNFSFPLDLKELDQVETLFDIQILNTAATGVDIHAIEKWEKNQIAPDIFCSLELEPFIQKGKILPLSSWVAKNKLFRPDNLYLKLLSSCKIDNELWGIPYQASAKVIYINLDLFRKMGIDYIPFDWNLEKFNNVSYLFYNHFAKDKEIPKWPFFEISELIPYLPGNQSLGLGWLTFDGKKFQFQDTSFQESLLFLRQYRKDKMSIDALTSEENQAYFQGKDPRLLGRVGLWVGDTASLTALRDQSQFKLSLAQIPVGEDPSLFSLPLTVYPLVVHKQSQFQDLAVDFASFIALDGDAIRLRYQLEEKNHFLPVVNQDYVWKDFSRMDSLGEELATWQYQMSDASLNPITNNSWLSQEIENICKEDIPLLLDFNGDFETNFLAFIDKHNIFP